MTEQSILVVDDEAPMRKLLSYNLKARGYAVGSAADGTEALKLIKGHLFDLLLLDINLPGPNGLYVLEAVRRTAQLPVLMLSGRGRESDKVEAFNLGADDYLSKPFGIPELLARITALLSSSDAARVPQTLGGPPGIRSRMAANGHGDWRGRGRSGVGFTSGRHGPKSPR
jgi:DNA-binding response OmpR family regulator